MNLNLKEFKSKLLNTRTKIKMKIEKFYLHMHSLPVVEVHLLSREFNGFYIVLKSNKN